MMDKEYINLRGKNLLKQLTENGKKPIEKEVVATLSTEDIEALILAIRSASDNTLSTLLEEHLRREPEGSAVVMPPCFHYWDGEGLELCDFGGSYSVIDKEQCENCPNYCVLNLDWERYNGDRGC